MWILAASATNAQNNPSPNNATQLITLNMRDAEIRTLTQWIAEQAHKQIVIDPRVQGRVTAYADRPMTVEQAYQVFLALLEVYGYSSSETGGILRIYPSAAAKNTQRSYVNDERRIDGNSQIVYILDVKNITSAALAQMIKPLLSATGYIASLDITNNLIIADSGDSVKYLADLARQIDRGGLSDIDIVKLHYANARDTAQTLSSLMKAEKTFSDLPNAAALPLLSIAADEHSNSVLLTGELSRREKARQLIAQIDKPASAINAPRIVFLNYLSAEELVPILKGTTAAVQKDAKEETIKNAALSIEASKSNNAIVLSGPPDLLDELQKTIAKLDVERPQILVEAMIVEVNDEISNDVGVLWSTDSLDNLRGSGATAATNTLGNLDAIGSTTGIDSAGNSTTIAAPAAGLTLGYYARGDLQAAIRALSGNSKANIVSTPSVLTLDNQQAQIIVGSNIPVITSQSTGPASSTDNPFTSYERKDIGVTLKITPQINADKSMTLNITQEVQSVANTPNTALASASDIVTNKRSISTKVQIADDKTLVLGGLISNQREDVQSKVPILGDIPLIGRLFRSTHMRHTRQNLLVFIHPHVIDNITTAKQISEQHYEQVRNASITSQTER